MFENFVRNNVVVLTALNNNYEKVITNNKILLEIEVMSANTMQNTWYRRVADFLDLFYKHGIGAIHVIPQHDTFDN